VPYGVICKGLHHDGEARWSSSRWDRNVQIVTTVCLLSVLRPFHVLFGAAHASIFIVAAIPCCILVVPKVVP
jgi:hypothetical protein